MAKTDAKMRMKKKVEKEFPEFVGEVAGMSVEQLEGRILSLAKHKEENREAKDQDEGLNKVLDMKAELEAPYRELNKILDLKNRYVFELIREKGGNV